MKHFLVGLITVVTVVTFAVFGSIWLATGINEENGWAVIAGTVMFFAACGGIYVIGEAIETTKP
jgi:hypothetical protein